MSTILLLVPGNDSFSKNDYEFPLIIIKLKTFKKVLIIPIFLNLTTAMR